MSFSTPWQDKEPVYNLGIRIRPAVGEGSPIEVAGHFDDLENELCAGHTATQLTHWAVALLQDNAPGLSRTARDAMADIDPGSTLGAGLWGYCPCTSNAGHPQFAALGHSGAATELQYSSNPDVAIAINLSDSIWVPDNRQDELTELFDTLRKLAGQAHSD